MKRFSRPRFVRVCSFGFGSLCSGDSISSVGSRDVEQVRGKFHVRRGLTPCRFTYVQPRTSDHLSCVCLPRFMCDLIIHFWDCASSTLCSRLCCALLYLFVLSSNYFEIPSHSLILSSFLFSFYFFPLLLFWFDTWCKPWF